MISKMNISEKEIQKQRERVIKPFSKAWRGMIVKGIIHKLRQNYIFRGMVKQPKLLQEVIKDTTEVSQKNLVQFLKRCKPHLH